MLIIVDAKLPEEAKNRLREMGVLMELKTRGITYDAISGHPDVFFCHSQDVLLASPGLPEEYYDLLNQHQIKYIKGNLAPGLKYPASALYNAVVTGEYVIHNEKCTDESLKELHKEKTFINVKQGYTRCSLQALGDKAFITSDPGIYQNLKKRGIKILLTGTAGILLPGMPNGFFGGTGGLLNNTLYLAGSLSNYVNGNEVKNFLDENNIELTELYDGPLMDVGSIIFIDYLRLI